MLILATSDGIHLLEGSEWRRELSGHDVRVVVSGESGWLAAVDGRSVWRRSAQGTWAELASVDGDELTCAEAIPGGLLAESNGDHLLLGTTGAHLLRMSATGELEAVQGFGRTPGRDEWYTPWGGPPEVRSIAVGGDGAWYVNVHVGGILRSADGGGTWAPTIDLHADVHQVICPRSHQPDLVLAACADGLAMSRDGGVSWRLRDQGLHQTYCRAVAAVEDCVIVSASDGPGGGHAGVFRADLDDGWAGFRRCDGGLPFLAGNIDTNWLVADDGVVALVFPDGSVFTSPDQGTTWAQVGERRGTPRSLAWL
ncbi:MAG: WD40/YVTN/BNR-like repeat-containing protein [Acidimicrobiales bacterium]